MKVAIAYNQFGRPLAESIIVLLHDLGHDVMDLGDSDSQVDYADIAYSAGREIIDRHADRAILICGFGVCTTISANKMKGLYAAPCYDPFEARVSRSRYDTNVLCLAERWTDARAACDIVIQWIGTPFEHRATDTRSLRKIHSIENNTGPRIQPSQMNPKL